MASDNSSIPPRPFGEVIRDLPRQYIRVLTKPSATTFAEEVSKARWDILLAQLFGITILGAVIGALFIPLFPALVQNMFQTLFANIPQAPGTAQSMQQLQNLTTIELRFLPASAAASPVYFFIGQGIYYLLARAFRGEGTFLAQSYTSLLFYIPLSIISSVISLLALVLAALASGPSFFVGLAIASPIISALGIYMIILQVFSLMATHRLSGGKATAVVLLPYAAFFVLYCIFFLVIFFAVFSVILSRPHP